MCQLHLEIWLRLNFLYQRLKNSLIELTVLWFSPPGSLEGAFFNLIPFIFLRFVADVGRFPDEL